MKKKRISLPPELLEKWAKMTDGNYHLEVRIEIAKKFRLGRRRTYDENEPFSGKDFVWAYECEKRIRDQYRCENTAFCCIVDRAMLYEIERIYGEETVNKVIDCL